VTVFAPDAVWEEESGARFESAREFIDAVIEGTASLDRSSRRRMAR
jgi:hypothetical protein